MRYSMNYIHCTSHITKLMGDLLRQMHQTTKLQLKAHGNYEIQYIIHQTIFSPHTNPAPSGISAWNEDMNLISFNNIEK